MAQASRRKRKNMFVGGFILVFSLVALISGVSMAYKTLRVRGWPTTTAKVQEKEVVRTETPSATTRTANFEVRVRYLFSVEGKEYTGDKVRPALEVTKKSAAQKIVDGLGDEVSVYYNPKDPAEAYITTNSLLWSVAMLIVGVFGSLIGLGMLLGGGKPAS